MKLVIHDASRKWSGNERQALLLARALTRLGHEVVFACHPRGVLRERVAKEGFRAAAVGPRGQLDLWNVLRFGAWLRAEQPDALLLVSPRRVLPGALAARLAGVPRTLMRIGTVRPDGTSLPADRGTRWVLPRFVDAVVANAEEVRANLRSEHPSLRPAHRVEVVANRVELPRVPRPAAVRDELGLARGTPLVAAVASGLHPYKGVDLLVRALAALARRDTHLVVMGDGPERERLRALAAAVGVEERTHWLGFRPDVPDVLAAADAFCSASRRDSMANAMLEAMAAGTLVVATETGGVAEALGPHAGRPAAGWLVPVDDEARLVAALDEALAAAAADSSLGRERREEARVRVLARYDAAGEWPDVERIVFGARRER